jgi:predicted O-linked N-acetylglucosamine transferase (SPINDLY family)
MRDMNRAPASALAQAMQLLGTGQAGPARAALTALTQHYPDDAEPWRLLGVLALQRGAVEEAATLLEQARQRAPESSTILSNLGALARQHGDEAEAERLYRQALVHDPRCVPALNNLAGLLFAQLRCIEAERHFRTALEIEPGHVPARGNLAACLLALDRGPEALSEAERAARDGAGYPPAWLALAQTRQALGQHAAAADAFERVRALGMHTPDALYGHAQSLDELGEWPRALDLCERALAMAPDHAAAASLAQYLRRHLGRHADLDAGRQRLLALSDAGAHGIAPFAFLSEEATPAQQRRVAELAAADTLSRLRSRAVAPGTHMGGSTRRDRLRVGFVSSGFGQHPTALLIVALIEQLRDGPIEAIGYATTPDDGGALRQRLRQAFAQLHDLSGMSYTRMAERIRVDAPDVLIDLRGWGGGGVADLFAQRPAPVQVNWLAYPGTSGAPWIDYLIADPFVIPDAESPHYSERIVRLPRCFQPSDNTRVVETPPPRSQLGLPEHGTVFTCFNNAYKYSPASLARFWRVLAAVPGSVLWMLAGKHPETTDNLRRMAASAGIDPSRLVFLAKQPHPVYLACYRQADLFLDTTPYNAHTTASDALWAGCPVLTLPGRTFASRVAGSLNHHLGLAEMNAADDDAFVARAIVLGNDVDARNALRQRLALAREDSGVFDMSGFARDFARALQSIASSR